MNPARQVVQALEDEGTRWAFGIPGTHNIELWDALGRSRSVEAFLVADERSGAFMADGVSRSSGGIGVLNLVPGAGIAHALSGIAEAFLDGAPLVVLACAVRSDSGRAFQLHDVDQTGILERVTKAVLRPSGPADVYAAVRRAFALARAGRPGPAAVEFPAELLLLGGDPRPEPWRPAVCAAAAPDPDAVREAARLLNEAQRPMIYAGAGAAAAAPALERLAEALAASVATTISGKGVFREDHPLWLWNGFGAAAPPFARRIARRGDVLLVLGARFSEVATGSYGCRPPESLIHVDVDSGALGRNYPARLAVAADAGAFLEALLPLVRPRPRDQALEGEIADGLREIRERELAEAGKNGVSPARFFAALQAAAGPDAVYAADSGQGTFFAMEQLRLTRPRCFLAPVDFSCMGYAVPAAIGAKLAAPERPVIALPGDGAFLMTGMELLTASARGLAPVVFVLRDRELGQIARFQRRALGRATATEVVPYDLRALAGALNCSYLFLEGDDRLAEVLRTAMAVRERPVVVELRLDGARETWFTRGVVAANFARLPLGEKARLAARVVLRRLASGA